MEVHHHPHLSHKEKPWKEYLLEGLMIFIAVTMGFIAESIHEHINEADRKRNLLQVVKQDFERDLKQLEFHEHFAIKKIEKGDSLIKSLDMDPKQIDQERYYDHITTIKGWWFFNSEEKSRNEAEAKGYFYEKENTELVHNIIRFNFFKNDYKNMEQNEWKQIELLNAQIPNITDFKDFSKYNRSPFKFIPKKMGVSKLEAASVIKTKYILSEILFNNDIYLSDLDSMKFYARKSIDLINKQYQ